MGRDNTSGIREEPPNSFSALIRDRQDLGVLMTPSDRPLCPPQGRQGAFWGHMLIHL